VPAELDELVQKLTARAAVDRPEHAAEVRDALRRLAHAPAVPLPAARAIAAFQSLRDTTLGPWVRQSVARYSAQSKRARTVQAGAAALVLISVVFAGMPGEDAAQSKPEAGAAVAAEVAAKTEAAAEKQQPAAPAAQPTVIDKVVKAAADAVRGTAEKVNPKAAPPAYPPELAPDVDLMLEGKSARERRDAADKVFGHKPPEDVAPHLRVIAELESARGCKTRKQAIAKMREQPDTRYLRSLQRLQATPHSGCGFLNLRDCYGCVRSDLSEAIETITASLPAPTN
jgi:hypothetical protein